MQMAIDKDFDETDGTDGTGLDDTEPLDLPGGEFETHFG